MSTVVAVSRQSLTVGTEVCIMTHSALISITHDAGLVAFASAQRSIAVYTKVALQALEAIWDRLKKWDKAMPRMLVASRLDAGGAVIPVRTVHAFMAHAVDGLCHKLGICLKVGCDIIYLITSVAEGKVTHIAARSAEIGCHCIESCLFRGWLKSVAGVMPMFQTDMARDTEIVVLADGAGDKV